MDYAELQVTTNYSFLRGGSHPQELVEQAIKLGHTAIGITDRNTLAGVVRAFAASRGEKKADPDRIKLLVGSRLETRDGYSLLVYPTDLDAYKRLSRLLTLGNRRTEKGKCDIGFDDLAEHAEGLLAISATGCNALRCCLATAAIWPGPCCFAATMPAGWRRSTISPARRA